MEIRSFFDEQIKQRRFSILFLLMGLIWMGIMGWLVVINHLSFINYLSTNSTHVNDELLRIWSLRGIASGIGFWFLIWIAFIISFSRFVPCLMGARPASGNDLAILSNIIEEVAIASGENASKITPYILEIDEPNAFACGKSTRKGTIVITRGLMDILDRNELRAVIAHEFAHLKNGDSFFAAQAISYCWALIAISVGTYYLVLIAFALLMLIFAAILKLTTDDGDEGCLVSAIGFFIALTILIYGIYYLFIYIVIMVLALFLVALGVKASSSTISKSREYLADACSAQWTREPNALASALNKIKEGKRVSIKSLSIAPLWINNPVSLKGGKLDSFLAFLLKTHPPIDDRIKKLLEMTGSYVMIDEKLKEILESLKPSFWRRIKEIFPPLIATVLMLFIFYGIYHTVIKVPVSSKIPEPLPSPSLITLYEVEVSEPVINLREGPSTTKPILAKLYKGQRLKALREENDWIMVEYNKDNISIKGWVYKKLVRKVK